MRTFSKITAGGFMGVVLVATSFVSVANADEGWVGDTVVAPIEITTDSSEPIDKFLERLVLNNDSDAVSGLLERTANAITEGKPVDFKGVGEYESDALSEYLSEAAEKIDEGGIRSNLESDALEEHRAVIMPSYYSTSPGQITKVGQVVAGTAKRTWSISGSVDHLTCQILCNVTDSVKVKMTVDPGFTGTRVQWKTTNIPAGTALSAMKINATTYRNQYANGNSNQAISKSGSGTHTIKHDTNTKGNSFLVAFQINYKSVGQGAQHIPGRTEWGACSSNQTTGFCTFN